MIDGGHTFQTITGFGSSEGFGQAKLIMNAPAAIRRRVLNLLYGTTTGAGLTILRNEMSAHPGDTIEPIAPRSPAAAPRYVPLSSTGQDQGQLWLAQTIKADYGVTNVFADAWSPPPFMKVNYSVDNGGALCGVPGAACPSGAVRIGARSSDATLTLDAFRNTSGTVTVVALNTAAGSSRVTFSLTGTGIGIQVGAEVTPYLTNSSSHVSAQPTVQVTGGTFTWNLPARSLVTFQIPPPGH